MKRPFLLAALLLTAATAGAQGVRINLPAWHESVLLDSMRQDHPIEALPADLYQAVLKSYATLGIPTGKTLGEAGIIGSEKFDRTHNFAGAPLSLSYECGDGATGPNADSYRLTIAVVAWVRPDPKNGKSILSLASLASAESVEGARRAPRACTSTGRIEGKIVDEVRKILGIE